MNSQQIDVTGFDYGDYGMLGADARKVVQQCTREIKLLLASRMGGAPGTSDVGAKLIAVREYLKRAPFDAWALAEFGWDTPQMATNYMNVFKAFGQIPERLVFGPLAVYLLSERSVPKAARDEALERAGMGETITQSIAQGLIDTHKAELARTRRAARIQG
jgi:hypothetical protein